MNITTKGKYGLRAMIDLAVHSTNEHVPLRNIAQRQNISENYLEQVFSSLRKAEIVKSIKGQQGGYLLAKKASSITVGDILRALEGKLTVNDRKNPQEAYNNEIRVLDDVWRKIDESINSTVDSITLEDLVVQYNNMGNSYMFYI